MKTLYIAILIGALCTIKSHCLHSQEAKFALVIGVKSYKHVPPLQNTLNDAQDMASMLKKKGFTVMEIYDPATKRIMQDGIRAYFKMLEGKPNGAGLVFYAGHGMQVKGVNYLIPTEANPQIEADLDDQCVNMDYVMRAIEQAGNGLNIFVLDACRNNPFRSFSRTSEKGLGMVDTPKGSYIVYATKPGAVASDGSGRNGLFTARLLKHIDTEGLNIEQVFKRTAQDVATASGDTQRPWIASDYTGDFYFTPPTEGSTKETTPANIQSVAIEVDKAPLDYGYGVADAPTVIAGSQEWFSKNLNVDHFANGDPIAEVKNEKEWKRAIENAQPAWCYHYNDPANGAAVGKLYNWFAVNDRRGLAPKGWHIPTDEEWDILVRHLVGATTEVNKPAPNGHFYAFFTDNVGRFLKNTSGWHDNGNGNNKSGLACLAGGMRNAQGKFRAFGWDGYWWTSSGSTPEKAWIRTMVYFSDELGRDAYEKSLGLSVRCVRD